ncbi:MAG: hypothetical protein ABSE40_00045 [Candidatus Sulfotelmatobacter sp.]|jgi:hypothetical protein
MRRLLPILVLLGSVWSHAAGQAQNVSAPAPPQTASPAKTPSAAPPEDENTRKAKEVVQQGIQALGGQAYLNIRDREQSGRGYVLHHGRQEGQGVLFWGFSQFPDKERVELTKERDVAELYVGDKGYEITYKGARPPEKKDLDDYLRQRHFSLDTVLRTWVNEPGVLFLFDGNAIAAEHSALQVTLINAKNESVTLYFDADTHLPVKKTFTWRDPVDRQKNVEEEIYDNYRQVSGVTVPYNVTRYFNGDMSRERFFFNVTINQGLDQAMFDPNSGYDPNKPAKKK